jgi:hypothetical protein
MAGGATSNSCGNAVSIEPLSVTGTNNTGVLAPTIFNYPVQPINDTGRQMAIGAIVGGLLDALMGGDSISGATDAEAKWKDILDNTMKTKGQSEIARADTERNKLPTFENDLSAQLSDYRAKADEYYLKLDPLNTILMDEVAEQRRKSDDEYLLSNGTCVNDAITALCQFVACGYTPDYTGIATRAKADAEVAAATQFQEACGLGNRYNTRLATNRMLDIRMSTHSIALANTAKLRETERQFMWKTNEDMRFKHANWLEDTRVKRRDLSIRYDAQAIKTTEQRWVDFAKEHITLDGNADATSNGRWEAYSKSGFQSFREGGEMLAAAAQAYQFLSASIRATAKQGGNGGGIAGALASIAAVLTIFNGKSTDVSIGGMTLPFVSIPKPTC